MLFADLDLVDLALGVLDLDTPFEVAPFGRPRALEVEVELVDVRGRGGLKGLGAMLRVVYVLDVVEGLREKN